MSTLTLRGLLLTSALVTASSAAFSATPKKPHNRTAKGEPTVTLAQAEVAKAQSAAIVAQTVDDQAAGGTSAEAQPAASAQTPPATGTPQQVPGDIIITGRKVSETLQRAPAAVDVISAQRLVTQGVTDVRAVQFLVPSARLNKQQAIAQMFIRGVGIATDAPGLDMGVAMTFNGVEQFREATGQSLFDIDRIEVLRGPQATTYGSNAAGGVVNILFRRPQNNNSGEASVEVGNYNRVHGTYAQNLPLGDKTQIRFAGDFLGRSGYASNGLDDQKTVAARLTLTSNPTDNFNFMVWGQYYHADGLGDVGYASPFKDRGDPWNQTWNPLALVTHFPNQALRNRNINIYEFGGEFNYDFGPASLTYIPGYIKMNHLGHLVIDVGPARILFQGDVHRKQMTHELRLASTDPASRLKWLLGAYYYHLDTEELRTVAANKSFNITDQPSRALAAYGQVTYSVTDPLRVTGGIRFSRIDKSVTGSRFTPGPSTANPTPIPFSADFKWNHVDWKVGADYDLTPNSMLYATVQTGYLGGGVNFFNSPLQSNEVKPENLLAYSLGMKNSFFGKTLRLNWEAFYYDWKNYQVGVFGVAAGTNIVFNAPKSRSYGFELDADWRITSNDHASLGFGYFHGKFTDFVVPRGVSSPVRDYVFTGYALPFAPNWTINGQYDHTFRLAGGSRLVATGSVQYTSKFWTSFSHGITRCVNVPPTVLTQDQCVDIGVLQPSLALVNLDLTWHSRDDRWNVSVWARNLTDKAIRTSGGDGGMTPAGIVTTLAASTLGPPRTYGARVGLSW